jgi:TPR repeat protein
MLGAAAIADTACVALGVAIIARPPQHAAAPVAALPAAPSTPSVTATPPVAAAAPDAASADEIAALMTRADQLVATGDIVAARGFYERAAEHGDAPAMTAAGKTYDPLFLEEMRVRGSRGDAGKAAEWYRRAGAAGDAEAAQRLKRLIARYAG